MENIEKIGGGIQDAETVEMGQKEFANLTRDVGFKIVFGTEGQSENLLMRLLNRLLGLKIISLKYLPTERLGLPESKEQNLKNYTLKPIMPHGRQKSENVMRN